MIPCTLAMTTTIITAIRSEGVLPDDVVIYYQYSSMKWKIVELRVHRRNN
jgi:hypothetical protein